MDEEVEAALMAAGHKMQQMQDEIERLRGLLKRCRPIIEADAQMMEDISRHAPLDAASQAIHDATEYESEKLARELECLLGPNAELARPPSGGPAERSGA